jgi:hypothetical protein
MDATPLAPACLARMLCHWSNGWSAENVTVYGMWRVQPVQTLTHYVALDSQEPIDIDSLTGRCRLDPAANCYQAGSGPGPHSVAMNSV